MTTDQRLRFGLTSGATGWSATAACTLLLLAVLTWTLTTGAFAQAASTSLYVDAASGRDTLDCGTTSSPCRTVAYVLSTRAGYGDTVLVAGGTYRENLVLRDTALTLRGGYVADGAQWRLDGAHPTIIDGNGAGTVFQTWSAELTLENVTITGGRTEGGGGGLQISGGVVTVSDAILRGNVATDHGGAITVHNGTLALTNVLVTDNHTVSGNANVLAISNSRVTVVNSTIADNNPGGAQAVILWSGSLHIVNSILWNNAQSLQGDPPCDRCFAVTYSDIEGGWVGEGNLNSYPRFTDDPAYQLRPDSPCVDMGSSAAAPNHDLDGRPRPLDGDGDGRATVDMGAYEAPEGVAAPVAKASVEPTLSAVTTAMTEVSAAVPGTLLIVTDPGNDGPGTLRQALTVAPRGATIRFDPDVFPPLSPVTITLLTQLPSLGRGEQTLDASEAGVVLYGGESGGGGCLHITSDGNAVSGLRIIGFPGYGVTIDLGASHNLIGGENATPGGACSGACNLVSGCRSGAILISGSGTTSNTVSGNYIGTDLSGTRANGNGNDAVRIAEGAAYTLVGGTTPGERNIVSGNVFGVVVDGAHHNIIQGNYLGLDATGAAPLGNSMAGAGIGEGGQHNLIESNVAAASGWAGLYLGRQNTRYNVIAGNYVGVDSSGTAAMGNGTGISINLEAQENVIGGDQPGDGNLISGNTECGISIEASGTTSNVVAGNLVGTDLTGLRALPNGCGIAIGAGASGNLIGGDGDAQDGTCSGSCNVLSGNGGDGIQITGAGTTGNRVAGNLIGPGIDGSTPLGNGENGITVREGAGQTVIGPANTIAFQNGFGVVIEPGAFVGAMPTALTQNAMYANHAADTDATSTGNVAYDISGDFAVPMPQITAARIDAVDGFSPIPGARIEIFSGDAPGEMRMYEGSAAAHSDGSFRLIVAEGLTGDWVTAILLTDEAPRTANATGFLASSAPAEPVAVDRPFFLMPLPGVATPRTFSLDPARVGLNLGLALFAVLYFGFTSSVTNGILESYGSEINRRLGWYTPRQIVHRTLQAWRLESTRRRWIVWITALVLSAVIESLLDPGPLFSRDRVGSLASLALASVTIGVLQLWVELRSSKRRAPDFETTFEPQPLGLFLSLGCVIVSRALAFRPGYIYGVLGFLLVLPEPETREDAGRRAFGVLGVVFGLGLAAWLLTPLADLVSADLSALLLSIYLVSLESVFFALPPLVIIDGGDLWRWDRRLWAASAFAVGFLFFHTVLNPGYEDVRLLQADSLFAFLTLCVLAGVLTLALWLGFPYREERRRRGVAA